MAEPKLDYLGKEIAVGDYVAYHLSRYIRIGMVTKINPRMLTISRIPKSRSKDRPDHRYSGECIKVSSEDVSMAILKGVLKG